MASGERSEEKDQGGRRRTGLARITGPRDGRPRFHLVALQARSTALYPRYMLAAGGQLLHTCL
jgi:hypothetical protein